MEAYAEEVVEASQREAGDEDVLRKVPEDFKRARLPATQEQLPKKMRGLLFLAAEQLDAESEIRRR